MKCSCTEWRLTPPNPALEQMDAFAELESQAATWGYRCAPASPADIVAGFAVAAERAVANYDALPIVDPCNDCPGHSRVCVTIPLDPVLFDQLMNGPTGYRAHYALDVAIGEAFNRQLVGRVIPQLVEAKSLYIDKFSARLCVDSLTGPHTKLWFPREFTDPSARTFLGRFPEVIGVPRWREYWQHQPKPWKGLLAPIPEVPAVLLNGTFVDDAAKVHDQKPFRSQQLFESGWT